MEIRINKIDAVRALYGRSSYHQADGNGNVKWKDGHETTAEETTAINAKVVELQAEYDANQYQRDRASAYDSIGNQLDLLFHDMTAGKGTKTGEWYKAVAKVKADNPKG
jgi:hypothetical protein